MRVVKVTVTIQDGSESGMAVAEINGDAMDELAGSDSKAKALYIADCVCRVIEITFKKKHG